MSNFEAARRAWRSKIVANAKVRYFVDPAGEKRSSTDEWIGPFGTMKEAVAKQRELGGIGPYEPIPGDDPKFPLIDWEYEASVRDLAPLERIFGENFVVELLHELAERVSARLECELDVDLDDSALDEMKFELEPDALERVSRSLVDALRREDVEISDLPVRWFENS